MVNINNITTGQDLQSALQTIIDQSNNNSLLQNPFEDVLHVDFVNPLTEGELIALEQTKIELNLLLIEIDNLQNLVDNLPGDSSAATSAPYLASLKARAQLLAMQIDQQEQIIQAAHKKYNDDRNKNKEAKAHNAAVTAELLALIDKFQVFKTEGLDAIEKQTNSSFDRAMRNFISDAPEILFTCEYFVEDRFIGSLLCFEAYKDATHYEILKRNLFQSNSGFERILVLSKNYLVEETQHFLPYVVDILGFKDIDRDNIFLILDTVVKQDRIYEYMISCAKVPADASFVDYDLIMQSQDLLTSRSISRFSSLTLFQHAGVVLSNSDMAWVVSLLNDGITFFGRSPAEQSLVALISNPELSEGDAIKIYVPKNVDDVLKIIQESMSLMGVFDTMNHLFLVLGGLPEEFQAAVEKSVDEIRNVFVYDVFRNTLKSSVPIFQLVLEIAETGDKAALDELSNLSISLPTNTGSESVTTIAGLTNVFKFVNDVIISASYAQDSDAFEKLKQIRALIEINRDSEDVLGVAAQAIAQQPSIQSATTAVSTGTNASILKDIAITR
jgi:hypothetical protein